MHTSTPSRGDNLVSIILAPSEKRSTLRRKNLSPVNKFFLFRVDHFQKGIGMQESKQEVTKGVCSVDMMEKLPSVLSSESKLWTNPYVNLLCVI